ncbi:ubiquinol-cytochrome-c reductase complex assembly factor 2-like [Xenia sp. Carnegie-2017]|uniref:ubiquinol-cytochrome-c reductase complex assembly factor 2-like n=1 Tax=Xenia sp. Carnegie-2017 TaxID=2897299 RepID=UPI001F0500AF|nr:ubiquinol-cytochrome-c reductase complex assembly factor 2-like [Xenia sp. Carnegie-2017]
MASRKSASQATQIYQRFLQICEQWPIDTSRQGRDLGSHIKENLKTQFQDRKIEEKEASRMLDSLIKISSNYYKEKYPRRCEIAFTQEAQKSGAYDFILSTDFQKQVKEKRPGFFARLAGKKE